MPRSKASFGSWITSLNSAGLSQQQRWIEPTETWKLQSLGITLGDALSQKLGMVWVRVEDEYGESPALRYPGTTLLIFPLTAISKRIERGEEVDVVELFDGLCRLIEEQKAVYQLN